MVENIDANSLSLNGVSISEANQKKIEVGPPQEPLLFIGNLIQILPPSYHMDYFSIQLLTINNQDKRNNWQS